MENLEMQQRAMEALVEKLDAKEVEIRNELELECDLSAALMKLMQGHDTDFWVKKVTAANEKGSMPDGMANVIIEYLECT